MSRRVVVTGMGGLSPIGREWKEVRDALEAGRTGVRRVDTWDDVEDFGTRLAAPVPGFETPQHWPRKKRRAMGRVSALAASAAERALEDAGLLADPLLLGGRAGVSFGSSSGSPPAMGVYAEKLFQGRTLRGIGANEYLQIMSHTCAANVANLFGLRGRVVSTCTACTSASQGIGFAYEMVSAGRQDVMLAGGAEELHPMVVAVFDILFSASTRNDEPDKTPRPFDAERDGLVVGEGAGCLIVEELQHALERGARIYAEIIGFGTNGDGTHMTNPDPAGMEAVLRLALDDAKISPSEVDYINAHGTATDVGDIAESQATYEVFGDSVPVSSLKGNLGHTLGACGALEAWMTLRMLRDDWFAPTRGLDHVDERCAPLDFIMGEARTLTAEVVMSNNFAFGGVNTSLLFRRWSSQ